MDITVVKNNLRIIVIDDNPAIQQDFIKILSQENTQQFNDEEKIQSLEEKIFGKSNTEVEFPKFQIETASQGLEGIEKINIALQEKNPYALAFVDVRMPPGLDGIETIKKIWEIDKNIQVVICTAYSDYSWEDTIKHLGYSDKLLILKKPFDNIAVRQLACALSQKWILQNENVQYTSLLEEKIQERTDSLTESLSLMRATLESTADGILVVDINNKIVSYNNRFLEMCQLPLQILESRDFYQLLDYWQGLLVAGKDSIEQLKEISHNYKENFKGKIEFVDGKFFEYDTQLYQTKENFGRVWSFSNITQRTQLEEKLKFQATHDVLTGLPNRTYLIDELKEKIAICKNTGCIFGLLFLDLDRFKMVNDSLSHEAGDRLLCILADRLVKIVGPNNTIARLGGDEFIILHFDITSDNELEQLALRIIANFNLPFNIQNYSITLSTSIGICVFPKDGEQYEILIRNADTAMYYAKELGANQYQFYTQALNNRNLLKLKQESELRHAIENQEFFVSYQPQFNLKTNALVSVEVLVRWNHPTKGTIQPLDFIPLAEETGLIVPLGEWVLRTACMQLKQWQDAGLPRIYMAVNVTTKQFHLVNIVQIVKGIIKESGIDPQYLELEITETTLINSIDIIQRIYELKALGIKIVLDDFGTGCSSLNYLRELPIDSIKIDQTYIKNINSKSNDEAIIKAMLTMARSLNLEVLAEGVENIEQLKFLEEHQCNDAQGFYFSKPISAETCEEILKKMLNK